MEQLTFQKSVMQNYSYFIRLIYFKYNSKILLWCKNDQHPIRAMRAQRDGLLDIGGA